MKPAAGNLSKNHDTPPGSPPLDLSVLASLVGDDVSLHHRLLRKFIDASQAIVSDINLAYDRNDPATVGALAHRLKSSARSVGALRLGELCEAIEVSGKAKDQVALQPLVPQLGELMAEIEAYAETIL